MTPDELRKLADTLHRQMATTLERDALYDAADAWEQLEQEFAIDHRQMQDTVDALRNRLEAAANVAYDEMYVRNVDRETMNAVRAKVAALAGEE